MGTEITREEFGERDYGRFRERLEQCLSDLERLLARPGFGAGPVTIGAELEVCLVDDDARPLPRNLAGELGQLLARVGAAARAHHGRTESVRLHEPLLPFVSDAPVGRGHPGVPPLDELRLHQGTVWRWNRAVYDPAAGGHLRIAWT
jgi:hypothetical protein